MKTALAIITALACASCTGIHAPGVTVVGFGGRGKIDAAGVKAEWNNEISFKDATRVPIVRSQWDTTNGVLEKITTRIK